MLLRRCAIVYGVGVRPRVEVTDGCLVLCARCLTWSRELALTSLVARPRVSPFGKLLFTITPSRARGLLLSHLSFFLWRKP
jgi:hypothetical protein